jgi:hypothetical protein
MTTPSPSTEPADADPALRRLRMLEELAEIGMDIARALRRRALDEAAANAAQPDDQALGLAFSRVARAVRQTLALEDRLDQDRQARDGAAQAERAVQLAEQAGARAIEGLRVAIHRSEVRAKVEQVIEAEAGDADVERLLTDLDERLDDDEGGADFLDRPLGELIAAICRDLGLTPDWSLWVNEDWAVQEAKAKPPGSPYAKRRPRRSWPETTWPDTTRPTPLSSWARDAAGENHPP